MNKIKLICVLCFMAFGVGAFFVDNGLIPVVQSYSSQPPPGMTGAPGEQNCSLCHDESGKGSITITAPANYVPGQTYQIQVQHATTDVTRQRWGFEATALDGANAAAGTFTDTSPFTQQDFGDGRYYIEHTSSGTFAGTGGGATWTFDWNAPATNIGPVTFYAAGNQANNNNNPSGDHVFLTTTVSEPAGPTPTETATATPTATQTPPLFCGFTNGTLYPIALAGPAVTTVDGTLYSFGGFSSGTALAASYKFDGSVWTPITSLPQPLGYASAVTDGTDIFVLGGATGGIGETVVYRYSVGTDAYTLLAPFTTATWNQAAVYFNGRIYKFGGTGPAFDSTDAHEIYDIAANTWTSGANYPIAASFTGAFLHGNFIYGAGGIMTAGSVPQLKTYQYDPVLDVWNDAAIADLPATRWAAASAFYNGSGVLAGGVVNGTSSANISFSVLTWDYSFNSWVVLPSMPSPRARMGSAILGQSLFIVGGFTTTPSDSNSNYRLFCNPVPSSTPTFTPTTTATVTNTPTPEETPSISGVITYGNAIGNPAPPRFVKNVSVASTAGSPAVGPVITGTPGTYTLTGFGAGGYTIRPTKPGGATTAVTSNDAARVAQGVSASVPFVSLNQKFASDASGNGTVSSNDAALIARFAAGLTGTGNVGQWKFFTANLPGPPTTALPTPPYNDSRSYASVTSNVTGDDYVALLIGEASGNYNPANHPRPAGKVESGKWIVDSENGGPERGVQVKLPQTAVSTDKEIVIPVSVEGVATKEIISYEFDLRYDPTMIQPLVDPVDVAGTASRGLLVVVNATEPGLLRVVLYGPMPIENDGVLLNLRFAAVGSTDAVSPLTFERIMFNEGESEVVVSNGQVIIDN